MWNLLYIYCTKTQIELKCDLIHTNITVNNDHISNEFKCQIRELHYVFIRIPTPPRWGWGGGHYDTAHAN
jgi:hypothetical protein